MKKSVRSTKSPQPIAPAFEPQPEPRGVLRIDFAQRKRNRELATQQVLDLLQRRCRRAFECAELVGQWIWVAFPDKQDQQTTAELSQLGFQWNNRRQVWQHPCGVFKGEPVDPRAKYATARAQEVAA
jgi:hypothetical protein